ncbi:MAG: histidine phosphatase family protein [Steroidobacteraceae bacterium]
MTKLILVRHGHIEGIEPERFRGREDVPLTATGIRQAFATARYIESRWGPTIAYTSPLERCVQTGAEIAKACAIELSVLDELNDLDYGALQWRLRSEVRAERPELYERWLAAPHLVRFPGGESLQELVARTADVLRLMLERHPCDAVVLVCHESGMRAMLLQLLDQPLCAYWRLSPVPCGISDIEVQGHAARVVAFNMTTHLS